MTELAGIPLNPMTTAPRDGSTVFVVDRGYGQPLAYRARVCAWWLTDEFIPIGVKDGDSDGANHGAIPEEAALGWLPLTEAGRLRQAGLIGDDDIPF